MNAAKKKQLVTDLYEARKAFIEKSLPEQAIIMLNAIDAIRRHLHPKKDPDRSPVGSYRED
jgi:hypothetical protein